MEQKKRIENIKLLIEEIKPFIKPKKYIRYSTAGKWTLTELLIGGGDKLNDRKNI
ncbi:hypothetical protein ES705_33695 [subsurface metagenome]